MGSDNAVSGVVGIVFMVAIVIMLAVGVYAYSNGMLRFSKATVDISYNVDKVTNSIIIVKGSSSYKYAEGTTPNLVFIDENGNEYYLQSDLSIGTGTSNLRQTTISGGDIITGFNEGMTYTIVWKPTNQVLGTIKF